jgi:hypothetical protein
MKISDLKDGDGVILNNGYGIYYHKVRIVDGRYWSCSHSKNKIGKESWPNGYFCVGLGSTTDFDGFVNMFKQWDSVFYIGQEKGNSYEFVDNPIRLDTKEKFKGRVIRD